jgi:lipoyl-dependent peroxiredoxin
MKPIIPTFVSVDGVKQGGGAPDENRSGGFDRGGRTTPCLDHETSARPLDRRGRPEPRRSLMAIRTARTAWNGTLQEGSGQVELSSSKVGTFDVSFPKRTAEDAGGTTSPEELIAAAHSSCLSMALSYEIARAGGTPQSLEVSADVTLGQKDGAPTITKIALTVRGEVEGLDAAGFEQAAQAAKAGCAVSRALAGVDEITLDATLES